MILINKKGYNTKNSGSTLIMAIVAIVVLGLLGVGMQQLSTSSTFNELMFNQANQARNLAYSGLNYVNGIALIYKNQSIPIGTVVTYLNTGGINGTNTYTVGSNGSFKITAKNVDATHFSVAVEGDTTTGGALQAKYQLPVAVNISYVPNVTSNLNQFAMYSTSSVTLNGDNNIVGSVYSKSSMNLNGGAIVTGSVTSSSEVILNKGIIQGNVCTTTTGTISWSKDAEVDKDVIVYGNLTLNGGTYKQNIYVTGTLNVNSSASIGGDIYAKDISINSISLTGKAYYTSSCNKTGSQYIKVSSIDYPSNLCSTPTFTPKDATISNATYSLFMQSNDTSISTCMSDPTICPNYFTAAKVNDSNYSAIDLTSVTLNNSGHTLYFDLSKGDINLLISGDVTFNKSFDIKISSDGSTWETFNPSNITATMIKYAKRIYLESHDTISFDKGTNWVGTLYAHNFNLNGNNVIVGAVYTTSSNLTANQNVDVTLVDSNFASAYWQ